MAQCSDLCIKKTVYYTDYTSCLKCTDVEYCLVSKIISADGRCKFKQKTQCTLFIDIVLYVSSFLFRLSFTRNQPWQYSYTVLTRRLCHSLYKSVLRPTVFMKVLSVRTQWSILLKNPSGHCTFFVWIFAFFYINFHLESHLRNACTPSPTIIIISRLHATSIYTHMRTHDNDD